MFDRPNREYNEAFYPNDLDSLKSVFVALCSEGHIKPDSAEANDIAAHLVGLFQAGITNETALKAAVRTRHQASMARSR
jgi:peptide subunit release factor 1 (eRF1)